MDFSITFIDGSRIAGIAIKIVHNDIDVTSHNRDDIMKCFIDRKDNMQITTKNYNVEFPVDNVSGFSI